MIDMFDYFDILFPVLIALAFGGVWLRRGKRNRYMEQE